jgi:hypothetical protein
MYAEATLLRRRFQISAFHTTLTFVGGKMTFEQTVEIPENRRLIIEVPREFPVGTTILTFTPKAAFSAGEKDPRAHLEEAIEMACDLAKNSRFSSEDLFKERRKDCEMDEAQYRRWFRKDGNMD